MYQLKLLIANNFWLLFIYNADSIHDLTSLGTLQTFDGECCYFPLFSKYGVILQT